MTFLVLALFLKGMPLVRLVSNAQGDDRQQLTKTQQKEYILSITKEGEDYFWDSGNKKKLVHSKNGAFDYFMDPSGGGYIKTTKQADGVTLYMEHKTQEFLTVTYWGYIET